MYLIVDGYNPNAPAASAREIFQGSQRSSLVDLDVFTQPAKPLKYALAIRSNGRLYLPKHAGWDVGLEFELGLHLFRCYACTMSA